MDATCDLYGICGMLVPQLPGCGSLHYTHQAHLEIAPLFAPLVEVTTLVGETHAVEGPGGSRTGKEY